MLVLQHSLSHKKPFHAFSATLKSCGYLPPEMHVWLELASSLAITMCSVLLSPRVNKKSSSAGKSQPPSGCVYVLLLQLDRGQKHCSFFLWWHVQCMELQLLGTLFCLPVWYIGLLFNIILILKIHVILI